MPKLCLITVPGLRVGSDWRLVHDRLLDEFPQVSDVLATTMKETILVVSRDVAPGDPGRWLDTISETIRSPGHGPRTPRLLTPIKRDRAPKRSAASFGGGSRVGLLR